MSGSIKRMLDDFENADWKRDVASYERYKKLEKSEHATDTFKAYVRKNIDRLEAKYPSLKKGF